MIFVFWNDIPKNHTAMKMPKIKSSQQYDQLDLGPTQKEKITGPVIQVPQHLPHIFAEPYSLNLVFFCWDLWGTHFAWTNLLMIYPGQSTTSTHHRLQN